MSEPEFEIEILEEEQPEAASMQLPVNFLTLGQVEPEDVKVYIRQSVYKALEKFAASDTSKELGSILFGDYSEENGKLYVVITDYIQAKYTDASAATLTFTHETWDYVHKEHAKRFPDKKIIGWQHTHPSYGIFLSNYDTFIQENFFNLPFQIAYVIDPVQKLRGFFQWKGDKIAKLHGYYVYDEPGKPIKLEQEKPKEPKKPRKKLAATAVALLSVLCVLLGTLWAVTASRYAQQLKTQQAVTEAQAQELEQTRQQLQAAEATNREQADKITQLETDQQTQAQEDPNAVTYEFTVYTVVAGDTLEGICAQHGISYGENKALILAINGISDPNLIDIGQQLLLPKE